jgi:hypothetical protein
MRKMLETYLRQAAARLLESAIRLAPPDARDWGQAMRAELHHVEGSWAALAWALGGASVLAKRALACAFMPARRGQEVRTGGGLFAMHVSLRKVALAAGTVYAVAALIFFAAPPFRQGLQVSLAAWNGLFHGTAGDEPRLRAFAKRAEAQHDPEGMVFAAARLEDAGDSARLAEEAVRGDPSLLWVYALVAGRRPNLAEIREWVPKLERWDPQNALPYLIQAESIDRDHAGKAPAAPPKERQSEWQGDAAWQQAMAAAFASPKFHGYLDRLRELDRKVAVRYGFNDPFAILWREEGMVWPASDAQQFAKSLLQSGQTLEAGGDHKGAAEKYWAVARFGQVIDSQGHSDLDHLVGTDLQTMAYKRLEALAAKEGNSGEAALFSYLISIFHPVRGIQARFYDEWVFGQETSRRNAAVLQIASLMMLVFSALIVIAASVLIIGGRAARPVAPRAKPVATVVALTSAMGLLLSSATVYLTYRPYWYIFQRSILKGDRSQSRDLLDFLLSIRTLSGIAPYSVRASLPVYFWTAVILLGIIALIFILLRHLRGNTRADELQPSAES